MRHIFQFLLLLVVLPLPAQAPPPKPIVSPEVHPDNRVTFRFRAPNARDVGLEREGAGVCPC